MKDAVANSSGDVLAELRRRLREAVARARPEGVLLSGGLDSGILASLWPGAVAITVIVGRGQDEGYASLLARELGLRWALVRLRPEEALEALPEVVRVLRTFDPALPNDLVVYLGLREARRLGLRSVMTGDGADELFAGYSYMQRLEGLEGYIRRLCRFMSFSSTPLGAHLGLRVHQPYLAREVVELALGLGRPWKVREEGGRVWGKWALRKAFEGLLPSEFIWQEKRPLEMGSGASTLRGVLAERISDKEFERARQDRPWLLCKEHLFFHELYRREVGQVPPPGPGQERCPACGAGRDPGRRHCRVCGTMA